MAVSQVKKTSFLFSTTKLIFHKKFLGQKQRVAIARACYQPASLVLLDDPLSALDSHVAKHVFSSVLSSSTGYLKDRTRVLVTNNIQLLPDVDQLVVMSAGGVSETGTYDQLLANNGKFAEFVREHASKEKEEETTESDAFDMDLSSGSLSKEEGGHASLRRQTSVKSTTTATSHKSPESALGRQKSVVEEAKKLIEAERAETGNVKWSVYLNYFRSLTYLWLSVMFFGFIAMQATSVASNVWLAVWANDNSGERSARTLQPPSEALSNGTDVTSVYVLTDEQRSTRNMRLIVYGILGVLQGKLYNCCTFCLTEFSNFNIFFVCLRV